MFSRTCFKYVSTEVFTEVFTKVHAKDDEDDDHDHESNIQMTQNARTKVLQGDNEQAAANVNLHLLSKFCHKVSQRQHEHDISNNSS